MPEEIHISSLVVYALPANIQAVCDAIGRFPGAEVHAVTEEGRIVVTLETAGEVDFLSRMAEIGRLTGVVSTALVFHQVEKLSDLAGEGTPWQ